MTGFKNVIGGIGHFVGRLWHSISPEVEQAAQAAGHAAETVAISAGTAAVTAAIASKKNGGGKGDIENAARDAGLNSLKTVGVSVGTDTLENLVKIATHTAVHTEDTPAPPSA